MASTLHAWLVAIATAGAGATVPVPAAGDELLVFAAVSLRDALAEIGADFAVATPHHARFNFAGSNLLALQIQAGARADCFISADEAQMDSLVARGLIHQATRRSLLSNRLVIVTAADGALQLNSAAGLDNDRVTRIAIAEPASVPAGRYAKAYLERSGLWTRLAPRMLPTENVRAALAAVAAGNADAAFVYRTDVVTSERVRIACEVPAEASAGISYSMAALREGRSPVAADVFLAWLASSAAAAVFTRHGFIVLAP